VNARLVLTKKSVYRLEGEMANEEEEEGGINSFRTPMFILHK
jgi:hypothetical protein